MGFDDLINKGKQLVGDKDLSQYSGNAQNAYKEFNSSEGTMADKAKAAYGGFQKGGAKEEKTEKSEKTETSEKK